MVLTFTHHICLVRLQLWAVPKAQVPDSRLDAPVALALKTIVRASDKPPLDLMVLSPIALSACFGRHKRPEPSPVCACHQRRTRPSCKARCFKTSMHNEVVLHYKQAQLPKSYFLSPSYSLKCPQMNLSGKAVDPYLLISLSSPAPRLEMLNPSLDTHTLHLASNFLSSKNLVRHYPKKSYPPNLDRVFTTGTTILTQTLKISAISKATSRGSSSLFSHTKFIVDLSRG